MAKRKAKAQPEARRPKNLPAGHRTNAVAGKTITTHSIGALPIINRFLKRKRLEEFLRLGAPSAPYLVSILVLLDHSLRPAVGARGHGMFLYPFTGF